MWALACRASAHAAHKCGAFTGAYTAQVTLDQRQQQSTPFWGCLTFLLIDRRVDNPIPS